MVRMTGGRTARPPMLVSLDGTARGAGWIESQPPASSIQHPASTRLAYLSSLNPGSTRTRSAAFPTAQPVAYIHCVTRVSFP